MAKVQIRRIENYELQPLLEAVADFLGNVPRARFRRSKRVLIKPNLLGAFPPERAVTTHPALVEALVLYFLDIGKEVWIGDSPGGSAKVEDVWQICGLQDIAERYPVKLVNLSTAGFRELNYEGIPVRISEVFWQCGIIINAAKFKTHGLVGYTGALKNLYGLVPGLAKTDYHRLYPNSLDFSKLLLALYALTRSRVTYSIIDGILGMDGIGPSGGRVRDFGLLMGSMSVSSLDYTGAKLMGFKLREVPYLRDALHMDGQLPSRVRIPTSFRDFALQDVDIKAVRLSNNFLRLVPGFVSHFMQRFYYQRPVISERCQKCGICVESCPVQAISPASDFRYPRIDRHKCIKCMCCHEMCPHKAIDIEKSFVARVVAK
jgi:uncharacterized protein (DUF362 family)/Pyruvate/2-oxoacid:ferredoxin oxidoreductase delta subunit